jgi:hypothetical protein
MEYRGIRYTIRAGIERGQWCVVIHPEGIEVPANKIFGAREDAELYAHRMIIRWLETKSGKEPTERAIDRVNLPLPLCFRILRLYYFPEGPKGDALWHGRRPFWLKSVSVSRLTVTCQPTATCRPSSNSHFEIVGLANARFLRTFVFSVA